MWCNFIFLTDKPSSPSGPRSPTSPSWPNSPVIPASPGPPAGPGGPGGEFTTVHSHSPWSPKCIHQPQISHMMQVYHEFNSWGEKTEENIIRFSAIIHHSQHKQYVPFTPLKPALPGLPLPPAAPLKNSSPRGTYIEIQHIKETFKKKKEIKYQKH